jgi:hypothetical protein
LKSISRNSFGPWNAWANMERFPLRVNGDSSD